MTSTVLTPPTRPTDAGVPRISHTKGWQVRRAYDLNVYVSPEGVEYVQAHHLEAADVIREFSIAGLEPLRLRRYENSSRIRHQQRAERRAERVTKARRAARRTVRKETV